MILEIKYTISRILLEYGAILYYFYLKMTFIAVYDMTQYSCLFSSASKTANKIK